MPDKLTNTYFTFLDLRKTSGIPFSSVTVLGGSYPNDGLGGTFYYDNTSTQPDNSLTIIKPNGITGAGRWIKMVAVMIGRESYPLPMFETIDNQVEYTFTDLIGATLVSVIIETNPLNIGTEVTLNPLTGTITIPSGYGGGQRVYIIYKK